MAWKIAQTRMDAGAASGKRVSAAQDANELIAALRQHVDSVFAELGSSNSVSVRVKSVGDW